MAYHENKDGVLILKFVDDTTATYNGEQWEFEDPENDFLGDTFNRIARDMATTITLGYDPAPFQTYGELIVSQVGGVSIASVPAPPDDANEVIY